MTIELSCAFATSPESHEHARIAEALGYRRAFFFDSPALYADVWVQLCRAAECTERIGLGPGVLIPSLRHPMTNAATVATLAGLAGAARVVVGVGSGFTGRMTMGPARHAVARRGGVRAHATRAAARGAGGLGGEAHPDAAHARLRPTTTAGGALHHRRGRPQGHCRRP